MTTSTAFWDKRAAKYAKRPIADLPSYEQTMDRTRAYLHSDDHVLELGCGTGATALLLAPSVARVTATDTSPGMIAQAEARPNDTGKVRFDVKTPQEIASDGQTYDVVTAFNLLHLLPDIPGDLATMRKLVKPGGLFISKSPCLKGRMPLIRAILPTMRILGMAPPVQLMSIDELERSIVQAGFDIVETGSYPASPPSRFVVARAV